MGFFYKRSVSSLPRLAEPLMHANSGVGFGRRPF